MDQVKKKRMTAQKTINALEQGINSFKQKRDRDSYEYEVFRESLIQRFEYTVDTFWKFMKLYMQDYLKILVDIAAPRGVLRAAAEAKLISHQELEQLLAAVTDRNVSSHAYDEDIAEQVVTRIPDHYHVIKTVFARMTITE